MLVDRVWLLTVPGDGTCRLTNINYIVTVLMSIIHLYDLDGKRTLATIHWFDMLKDCLVGLFLLT